ncbi:hypothetical protein Vretimale_3051, partial [Volvox reticuliferus]
AAVGIQEKCTASVETSTWDLAPATPNGDAVLREAAVAAVVRVVFNKTATTTADGQDEASPPPLEPPPYALAMMLWRRDEYGNTFRSRGLLLAVEGGQAPLTPTLDDA